MYLTEIFIKLRIVIIGDAQEWWYEKHISLHCDEISAWVLKQWYVAIIWALYTLKIFNNLIVEYWHLTSLELLLENSDAFNSLSTFSSGARELWLEDWGGDTQNSPQLEKHEQIPNFNSALPKSFNLKNLRMMICQTYFKIRRLRIVMYIRNSSLRMVICFIYKTITQTQF